MSKNKMNLSALEKIIAVFVGAFIVGFMWHVRGQHGFGAKWGMFSVAFALVLYIYSLYGKRQKMNYEMIPLTAAFAAITAGGWGTLNSQIGGVLSSSANFPGEEVYRYVEISSASGWAIMVLLGFGWLPLFSIVLGSLFSKKKYEFKDYVIFVGVYYITMLLCNLTISHLILGFINPQAVESCAEGIKAMGYDMSPMKAFIVNFGSAAWAKPIPFCRNYFQSIKVISSAIGALVSSIVVGAVIRDKFNAVFSMLSNLACGIGISVSSLTLAISNEERTIFTDIELPRFISYNAWELWEYFTGFVFGLLLMIVIVCLPKKYTDSEEFEYETSIRNEKFRIFYHEIFTLLFSFGVILSRAIGFRLPRAFFENDTVEIIITILLSVIVYFVFVRKIIKENMREKKLPAPFDLSAQEFSMKALPVFVGVASVSYFLMGGDCSQNILAVDYSTLFSQGGFYELWSAGYLTDIALMLPTLIVIMVLLKAERIIRRRKNNH